VDRSKRVWLIALISFMCITVFIAVTAVLLESAEETQKISTQQDKSAVKTETRDELLRELRAVAQQIRSCTTPGEPCSNRNQRATAKAVAEIARANTAAAAAASSCAVTVKPPTFNKVYRCTLRTLDEAQ
jgi:hypothetical protein